MIENSRHKLLVIRLSALGDVAMTLPVSYSLARQYPELDVYVLTRPFFAKMFINAPSNLKVIVADFKKEYKGMKGMARLLRELSRYKFDYVADFHNVLRSWEIGRWLSLHGSKLVMVDKKRRERKALLKGRIDRQQQFIDRYVDVLSKLGFPVTLSFDSIFGNEKPQPPLEIKSPSVGIAPFARYYNKTYPLTLMERVVEILVSKGVSVYLFGGRGEEAVTLDGWASVYDGAVSVAGKFQLADELKIMANLDVMVSMDSANQHLASLTGIKVVTIWGSTTPACGFMPYGQDESRSIVAGVKCQPCTIAGCEKCPLGSLDCMNLITPDKVVESVLNVIESDNK